MKQKLLPLIVLSLVFALPVFADSTTTKKTEIKDIREQAKGEIKDIQEKAKTEIKDIQETLKDKRGEIKKEVAAKRVSQTLKVYTEAADRLDRIVVRIESRIAKIKAAGGDTTAIQTSLDLGKTKLAEARANIAAFAAIDVSSATSTSTAQTLFNSMKVAAAKAKEALKVAHASLVKTITLIQGLEKTVKVKEAKEDRDDDDDSNASSTKDKKN